MRRFTILSFVFFIGVLQISGSRSKSSPSKSFGMPPDTTLFPGLEGQELLDSLVVNFTPTDVIIYAGSSEDARDTLFKHIYNLGDDSLRCVYTAFTIKLDPAADPSGDAFTKGLSTEHTYPQSKGAEHHPPRGDMHHLFPVKANVNSSRSNHPYADIVDINTNRWFWLDTSLTTIPPSNIDEYSEKLIAGIDSRFETREDQKGNAARAVFYFFTIYRDSALAHDSTFFDLQKDDLLIWNHADAPDSLEDARNVHIESFQGNKNPFIMDTSLVRRAFFFDSTVTSVSVELPQKFELFQNFPNPFNPTTQISFVLPRRSMVHLEVYNLLGQRVNTLIRSEQSAGRNSAIWDGTNDAGEIVGSGVYIYRLRVGGYVQSKKMLFLK